ncbi:MAG: hypothetical protein AABY22_34830 [Nanoarchaeota archaeon]
MKFKCQFKGCWKEYAEVGHLKNHYEKFHNIEICGSNYPAKFLRGEIPI